MNLLPSKFLITDKKIERTSETTWQVGEQIVKLHRKPGRSILSCSCQNYALYNRENPICKHSAGVIIFESNFNFNERIDNLIEEYEKYKRSDLIPTIDMFVQELKLLKFVK